MGAEPGDEKLHPDCQHLPLLGALQDRLLQGLQRQAVSARGRRAHDIRPVSGLDEGESSPTRFSRSLRMFQLERNRFVYFIYLFIYLYFALFASQIELRKRAVVPKETTVANQMGTQADRDKMREAAMRREKRGGMRVRFLSQLTRSFF